MENASSYYSEIDKASPRESSWSTWPEDLRNVSAAQTYVNVSSVESASSFTVPAPPPPPPPPPPPSVGPNESPSKPKSNCELAQSMNELSLNSSASSNIAKKLDPTFLAELEKHLGEKEATKNTNSASNRESQELGAVSANYLRYSSSDKLRQESAPTQQLSTTEDVAGPSSSVIPTLKPPPQAKPKSPIATDHRGSSSSSTLLSKVQNSWQPKSTNIQKPSVQSGDQRMSESATDTIVNQIWQQAQTLPQQKNVHPVELVAGRQMLTPVPTNQDNINLLQETTNLSNTYDQSQYSLSNVAKATFVQTQACSSNQNTKNTTHISYGNVNLLQGTATNIAGNTANETQYGPCNVSKVVFNQAQACSSNSQTYLQNSCTSTGQSFNLLQIVPAKIPANVTRDPLHGAANVLKTNLNQTQVVALTGNQSCVNASNFSPSQPITNHTASNSISGCAQYRSCNFSKAVPDQTYSSTSQNCSQNATPVLNQNFALHQSYPQNVIPTTNNTHGITHIQNDLQQPQHLKPTTLLSEQVYAELKQMVRSFHDEVFQKYFFLN